MKDLLDLKDCRNVCDIENTLHNKVNPPNSQRQHLRVGPVSRVYGLRFRVESLGFRAECVGFRV